MIPVKLNDAAVLELILSDGEEDLYPRAFIYAAGATTPTTTVDLTHKVQGRYYATWTPSSTGVYTAVFILYADAGHTIESIMYGRSMEQIQVTQSVVDDLAAMLTRVLGLTHENVFIDNTVYAASVLTSARMRLFSSKASCEAATDGGTETGGLVATYEIDAETEAGSSDLKSYRMVKV